MKNDEIVRALPHLKTLKYELKTVNAQLAALQKQREQLNREIYILDTVDEVIDGIAVRCSGEDSSGPYGKLYHIRAIAPEIDRSAEVYPNVHTSEAGTAKDWGIKIDVPNERWLNTGWAFKDAVEIARRFVTHGELPNTEQQEMARARHKLDPEGRAPKRRREAFEAAWLAKHTTLAGEILLGRVRTRTAKED